MKRQDGSVLLAVMTLSVLVGVLTSSMLYMVRTFHMAATESFDREASRWGCDSGVSHYLFKVSEDQNYFLDNPAPHSPQKSGEATFELESAAPGSGANQWDIVVLGSYGESSYRMAATIGNLRLSIPTGIVVAGTGNSGDTVLNLGNDVLVGSYDPATGAFDPAAPDPDAQIGINGSLSLGFTSSVFGDVAASGTLTSGDPSSVNGTLTENAPETTVEDIDPIVQDAFDSSKSSNNNGALLGIFGLQWSPVIGLENYGDLIVTDGNTHVVPAGTYRFRRLEVKNGSTVVFDTGSGPSQLVYVGSGAGTGTLNDLIVDGGSAVRIDPGGTSNGLLTVLGSNADFKIRNNSIFGQVIGDVNNAGYSQIISLGGNASSDDIKAESGSSVYGRIYATSHELTVNNANWFGSAVVRTVSIDNGNFAVDEGSLGTSLADPTQFEVLATWRTP